MRELKTYDEVVELLDNGWDPVWFAYGELECNDEYDEDEATDSEISTGIMVDFCCHFRLDDGKIGPFVECDCTHAQAKVFAERAHQHLVGLADRMLSIVNSDIDAQIAADIDYQIKTIDTA